VIIIIYDYLVLIVDFLIRLGFCSKVLGPLHWTVNFVHVENTFCEHRAISTAVAKLLQARARIKGSDPISA